jgi:hypothetical protein
MNTQTERDPKKPGKVYVNIASPRHEAQFNDMPDRFIDQNQVTWQLKDIYEAGVKPIKFPALPPAQAISIEKAESNNANKEGK